MNTLIELQNAEKLAIQLFQQIEDKKLIVPGKLESTLNKEILLLAKESFGIDTFWHKRIVRAGKNTLLPYRENPPDLVLQEDDILFFDFGPVFEKWEADLGRTYVLGNNPLMLRLKEDVELVWKQVRDYYLQHKLTITGAELYQFSCECAQAKGWEYGNEHAGHLIGKFPHEKILWEERVNYIHPENYLKMSEPDRFGNPRNWILEIHLIDKEKEIGAFFEQLLI